MISFINGRLIEVGDDYIIVSTSGIGFMIYISQRLKNELPQIDEDVFIYTYFKVSEDAMSLYGFNKRKDLDIFKKLIDVKGVGPKAGLSILSILSCDELVMAIVNEEDKIIAQANGVGPKTAKRIVLELKDKLDLNNISLPDKKTDNKNIQDAIEGLVALGYSRTSAINVISTLHIEDDMNADKILSMAIRKL